MYMKGKGETGLKSCIMYEVASPNSESAWHAAVNETKHLYSVEALRRKQARIVVLENHQSLLLHEVANFHRQAIDARCQIRNLQRNQDKVNAQFRETDEKLKACERDRERLQAKIAIPHHAFDQTLHGSDSDSVPVAIADPEPRGSNSMSSHAKLVKELRSENTALQLQLSAVEVELKLEKSSNKRRSKTSVESEFQLSKVSARLKEVTNRLVAESDSRARLESELQKMETSRRAQSSSLEAQLFQSQSKLKTALDELEKTKNRFELSQEQESVAGRPNAGPKSKPTIQVPRHDGDRGRTNQLRGGLATKTSKRELAQVGEKSSFHLSPLVSNTNKVIAVPRTAILLDSDTSQGMHPQTQLEHEQEPSLQPPNRDSLNDPGEGDTVLRDSALTGRSNVSKLMPVGLDLEKFSIGLKNVGPNNATSEKENHLQSLPEDKSGVSAVAKTLLMSLTDPSDKNHKRKRKLGTALGRAIIEDDGDDDGDEANPIATGARAVLRKRNERSLSNIRFNAGGLQQNQALGTLMGFSPLKKERRRAVA